MQKERSCLDQPFLKVEKVEKVEKVALCFIISYSLSLNKEKLWIEWINHNKDIINIYFHYKGFLFSNIKSNFVKKHAIPETYLKYTDYFHIVPAYMTLLQYGIEQDKNNKWFCFLTESCVPIISPSKFRELFFENYNSTIMNHGPAYWNPTFTNRANLHLLTKDFHMFNTPWFILKREDAELCLLYVRRNNNIYTIICNGNIANESIFAIILKANNKLDNVKNEHTTITDWKRMTSTTSPHLFKEGSETDINFIDKFKKENKYSIFLRKVDPSFPDDILNRYIYNSNIIKSKTKSNSNSDKFIFIWNYMKLIIKRFYNFTRENPSIIFIGMIFIRMIFITMTLHRKNIN